MKKCPFCAEEIQDAAIKCRYCKSTVEPVASTSAPATSMPPGEVPTERPPADSTRRFHTITEADVRILSDGAPVELESGGRITLRAQEELTRRGITVVRRDGVSDASPRTLLNAEARDAASVGLPKYFGFVVVVAALGIIGWMITSAGAKPPGSVPQPTPTASVAAPENRESSPDRTTSVTSISTAAGRLKVGDTWDEALPKVNSGRRVSLTKDGADRFVDTRTLKGITYTLVFDRPHEPELGPYRLTAISTSSAVSSVPAQISSESRADTILAEQKAEAQRVTDTAVALVQKDMMASAISLYRSRLDTLRGVRRQVARDPSLSREDKARVDSALKAEQESVARILAEFDK